MQVKGKMIIRRMTNGSNGEDSDQKKRRRILMRYEF
jgi:hypothetical protein